MSLRTNDLVDCHQTFVTLRANDLPLLSINDAEFVDRTTSNERHSLFSSSDFLSFDEKYEIVSSSIHSVFFLTLIFEHRPEHESFHLKNYWRANYALMNEINQLFPEIVKFQQIFGQVKVQLDQFQLDDREFSLLILVLITRTSQLRDVL